MLKLFLNTLFLSLFCIAAKAQELSCKVKIQHNAIRNVDNQVFITMEKSISDFLTTRKWTPDDFATNEKIEMNILINLVSKSADDDIYNGTLNIQASRPVFNSGYNSPTVNYVDRDFTFKYSQFTPLTFDDNRISNGDALASNLTAVLAYYAYVVIGLDYDSFAPLGGNPFFKKAQNIVNNAPESGKSIPGWKAVDGNKNRYWLIDQILSPRFSVLRNYWYTLHREGLDKMYNKSDEARAKILAGIPALSTLNKENPSSIYLQFFFNAKTDELARVVAQVPKEQRTQYTTLLGQMDVPNAVKYEMLNR